MFYLQVSCQNRAMKWGLWIPVSFVDDLFGTFFQQKLYNLNELTNNSKMQSRTVISTDGIYQFLVIRYINKYSKIIFMLMLYVNKYNVKR